MASNFDFLHHEKEQFFDTASKAEALARSKPRGACFYARYTLEQAVHWLYANDANLRWPGHSDQLGALVHERTFVQNMPKSVWNKVRVVLKVGNHAAHNTQSLGIKDSEHVVKSLFHVLYWISRVYADDLDGHPDAKWDRSLLPAGETGVKDASLEQVQALSEQLDQSANLLKLKETRLSLAEDEIKSLQAEVAQLKKQNQAVPDKHDYNEDETRRYLIDVLLREAGWPIERVGWTEVEVEGMPLADGQSKTGKGYVDYVLWDDNGLPLGLVEAKRSMLSAKKGQQQAKLYADALEKKFGQRPIIFGSNGYEHWIWDDVSYPPRDIEGFYKKDELRLLIHRRKNALPLHTLSVDPDIAGRPYQIEALRRLTEDFQKGIRKGLLVMATGTGKTRTAIALVDLLKRADRVKRVLFLADRNALVTQAKRAFTDLLPSVTAEDITKVKDTDATVILSTYPTMINRINDVEDGERRFGPGHFDLIIVDEAHRSIYKKYGALFDYFDGLLVGLTATPEDKVHRDTYKVFDLQPGVPTFAYELEDAVEQKYLCPPRGVRVEFKFIQSGVKYSDLPKAEREHYEEIFEDPETGDLPPHINKSALNVWLFNEDTVDKALKLLMDEGLKTHEGDRLGKTIIFARNQKHAEFIVERFDLQYPHLKGHFCRVIHSAIDYPQSLLDEFSVFENDPVIAVSVDMLDTGVDVPELLNLVFFKPVRTAVKFNQMLGRGTRLCEDLFGLGQHKTEFLVFDLCDNFAYFEQQVQEHDGRLPESLTSRLVSTRLDLLTKIRSNIDAPDEATTDLAEKAADELHAHVAGMNLDNFLVRKHRKLVEEFSERERWEKLSPDDVEQISEKLGALPTAHVAGGFEAKQFDVLCLRLQLTLFPGNEAGFVALRDRIRDMATALQEKESIPMVAAEIELIEAIQSEDWWTGVTLALVEQVRRRLRSLVHFIDKVARDPIISNFQDDVVGFASDVPVPTYQTGFSRVQYRKKVDAFVRSHQAHVVVAKLRKNIPLTEKDLESLEDLMFSADEIEGRERFEEVYGEGVALPLFIRKIVGLDEATAREAFGKYLAEGTLSATQIQFVETIISFLTSNGVLDPKMLWQSPFKDMHYAGLSGLFPDQSQAAEIVSILRSFNEPVGATFQKKAAGG